jgi:hypothetical protein
MILAAFDLQSIISLVTTNIVPLLIGGGIPAIPINKPGTPYKPLLSLLFSLIGGKPTTTEPANPILAMFPMLAPLLQQLADKKPVEKVVPAPDPAVITKDPSQLLSWLLSTLNAPEKPDDHSIISKTNEGDIAHLLGCANAVAAKNPDSDVTIKIDANGVDAKVVKRAKP